MSLRARCGRSKTLPTAYASRRSPQAGSGDLLDSAACKKQTVHYSYNMCEDRTKGLVMPAPALAPKPESKVEYFPASKPWRQVGGSVHLVGMSCAQCGTKAFPAREVCSACG